MLISRLSLANLKKKKGAAVTLMIFILLATALLNIGLALMSKMEDIYAQKEKALNAAQFVAISSSNTYKKEFEDFVFQDDRIALAEKEEAIYMPTTKNKQNSLELAALIFNLDANRKIAPLIPIEEDTTIPKDKAIYVPLMLKSYNLSIGDNYDLIYKGKTYSFIVAGFFETTYYGTSFSGYLKYYVPNESYQLLYSEIGRATILSARFKEANQSIETLSENFTKEFNDIVNSESSTEETDINWMSSASMKSDCMMFISITATVLIAFALVVFIIIMIVIYNRVVESIDESMQNIGVLGSIGYTTKQIMASFIFEFLMLSGVGSILGIILSYTLSPVISNYLVFSGINYKSDIHIPTDIICFCIVLFSIGLTAFLSAIRIIKLPPVKALNKGTTNHVFNKNRCPLHKGMGSIHFRIGLKNVFVNKKSNISFTLIISGALFALGLSMVMYMNFGLDTSILMNTSGSEMSDLQIIVTENTDTKLFSQELQAMKEVRKTNLSDLTKVKLENTNVAAIISDNFDAMENLSTYEGDMPRYDNEIAITGILSNKFHKGIGDTVKVTAGGRTQEYCVTGIYQSMYDVGYASILSLDGIRKLRPEYKIGQIHIYLKDGVNKEQFKEKLRSIYKVTVNEDNASENSNNDTSENGKYSKAAQIAEKKIAKLLTDYGVKNVSYTVMLDGKIILSADSSEYKIKEITDVKGIGAGQLDAYARMIAGLVSVIAFITLLVIAGILSITIKSQIRKNREEYGIYKAMGYTNKDLVKQLSINYVITSILGTIIGSIATIFLSNPTLQLLLMNVGLTRLKLSVNIPALLILDVCMVIFIYLVALMKANKIKKITAYDLLTE